MKATQFLNSEQRSDIWTWFDGYHSVWLAKCEGKWNKMSLDLSSFLDLNKKCEGKYDFCGSEGHLLSVLSEWQPFAEQIRCSC